MAIQISALKNKETGRVVRAQISSLVDEINDMDGEILIRVLPVGRWRELSEQARDIGELPEDASEEEKLMRQFTDAATFISACLTDEDKTVISFDDAMALCIASNGLDGMQIREVMDAIQSANGLITGN